MTSIIKMELQPVEYQIFLTDDGYDVYREGARYDFIPFWAIRIFVNEQTLLDSYLAGEYVGATDRVPPGAFD